MSKIAGHTMYVTWGKFDEWFRFEWNKNAKRLVLGKFVISIVQMDIEVYIVESIELIKQLKGKKDVE